MTSFKVECSRQPHLHPHVRQHSSNPTFHWKHTRPQLKQRVKNLKSFHLNAMLWQTSYLSQCHNLRTFMWRKIEPKSTFVEKRWQISGLHYLGNTFTLLEQYWDTAWALLGQYQETILPTLWQYSGTSLTYVRFFPNSDLGPFIFCHTWHMYISEIYKDSKCQDREERQ